MIDLNNTTVTQNNFQKLLENRDWLENNLKDLQTKYLDKWVAIAQKKVIGHGDSPDQVKKEIEGNFSSLEVLLLRVPRGEISRPV